ncbi:MAG: hypothetical protein MUC55_12285 [Burkholderiales bacterium]|jgi:hypothetical protein|nr:hypothetical protein [Burkholderiales bacterium]
MRSTHIIGGLAAFALASGAAVAKLPDAPAPTPEQAAKAAEAKAKADWSNKVAAYKQCMVENAVAEKYANGLKAQGKTANIAPTPCADPGPFQMAGAPAPAPAAAAAPAKK